jgi:hypothetical protein
VTTPTFPSRRRLTSSDTGTSRLDEGSRIVEAGRGR